jgi:hypothetical protein
MVIILTYQIGPDRSIRFSLRQLFFIHSPDGPLPERLGFGNRQVILSARRQRFPRPRDVTRR